MQLSSSLSENLAAFNTMFGPSADYYTKQVTVGGCPAAILLFDGMASLTSLWHLLLDAVDRTDQFAGLPPACGQQVFERLLYHSGLPAQSGPVRTSEEAVQLLTAGFAILLLDGCGQGIAFSVQSLQFRSVGEPSGEGNLRGSREGFADLLRVNLSLLRRLVRSEDLVMEVAQAGTAMQTEYALCYCRGKADREMVARVRGIL